MDNILIIGAGDFQLPLVQRASQSYNVYLAAPVISDMFKPYITGSLLIDVRDEEAILQFAREHSVCGVITDQTDIAVRSVAYVAENLGLPGIGYETGVLFTDKSLMRTRMAELGIKLLPNRTVSSLEEALSYYEEIGGDVIIKPLDTQGSRGVQICRSAAELESKYAEAARWSSGHNVIIERYATGREFVVEGLAVDYEFRNLCIGDTLYFDLPDAFAAKSRIFPTLADDELAQRVLDLNTRIITGFGLRQGITHSEFIMDGDEIYLIETAARGGGVFISSDLIHLSCGLDTEGFLLDIASGKESRLTTDGSPVILNGYASWVYYEEIFGRPSRYRAFWWSPDSRTLAFYRFDDSEVPMFPIYSPFGQDGKLVETHYPKAGEKNPKVRIGFCDLASEGIVWADFDEKEDQYFGTPFWSADSRSFFVPREPRIQNTLDLYAVSPSDGGKKAIYHEQVPTWLDWIEGMLFGKDGLYMVRSFETGWEQIYYLSYDGKVLRRLTEGTNWRVSLQYLDKKGNVYFTARRDSDVRHTLYRLSPKGVVTPMTDLSLDVFRVSFSPDGSHFAVPPDSREKIKDIGYEFH